MSARRVWDTLRSVATIASLALGASVARAQQPADRFRAGVTVTPDTVTVGDPLRVRVRIQAPAGTTITFPDAPDSAATVAARDPRRIDTTATSDTLVDVTATYTLAAWDVGTQPLRFGDVVVRIDGADRRIPLGGYTVFVRSVLPADTSLRKPKPPRPPLADAPSMLVQWWPWLVAILAAIGLIVWTIVRWLRRRRAPKAAEDPYQVALAELTRLEKLGLVEAGERGRLVALSADVVRAYLAARVREASPSHTSSEVVHALHGNADVPVDRLAPFLDRADLVKFAAVPVSADGARAGLAEARAIVEATEAAIRARQEREAAEAEANRKRARDEQRRYEDEQRRTAKKNKKAA